MKAFDLRPLLEDDRKGKTKQYPYFTKSEHPSDRFQCGYIIFPPGGIAPLEGQSCHKGYEISYVVSGSITVQAGEGTMTFNAGNTIFIPPGESHNCVNNGDDDCVVAYMIVEG